MIYNCIVAMALRISSFLIQKLSGFDTLLQAAIIFIFIVKGGTQQANRLLQRTKIFWIKKDEEEIFDQPSWKKSTFIIQKSGKAPLLKMLIKYQAPAISL